MGCNTSSQSTSPDKVEDDDIQASNEPVVANIDFKPIHSAIRWKKPIEEVAALLKTPGAADVEDPGNGNRPIHIAAQNGHLDILQLLIKKKANLNAQNLKGNTAIHMAISYDYYDCVKAIMDAGGDPNIKNASDFPAIKGIEGDKHIGIAALISAKSTAEALNALKLCENSKSDLDKASFASAGMKTKKTLGEGWNSIAQDKFKAIMADI